MSSVTGYGQASYMYDYAGSAGDALAQHYEQEERKKAQDSAKNLTEGRKINNANGIRKNVEAIQ